MLILSVSTFQELMKNYRLRLIFQALLLLVLFFGLISIITNSLGKTFYLELLGLLVLLSVSLASLINYQSWGERVLFFVYLGYLINLLLFWYFHGSLYLLLLILTLAGFLLSLQFQKPRVSKPSKVDSEPHSMVFPAVEVYHDDPVPEAKAATKFTPGKYVASKQSNIYHEPKCDWAKKIRKERRLWFVSKQEAINKGFRAHDCVK